MNIKEFTALLFSPQKCTVMVGFYADKKRYGVIFHNCFFWGAKPRNWWLSWESPYWQNIHVVLHSEKFSRSLCIVGSGMPQLFCKIYDWCAIFYEQVRKNNFAFHTRVTKWKSFAALFLTCFTMTLLSVKLCYHPGSGSIGSFHGQMHCRVGLRLNKCLRAYSHSTKKEVESEIARKRVPRFVFNIILVPLFWTCHVICPRF